MYRKTKMERVKKLYFKLDEPSINLKKDINAFFWFYFNKVKTESIEVHQNDLLQEMSNHLRRYGAIIQFINTYHYFKFNLVKLGVYKDESHRYRSQIINVYPERQFDLDFEIHRYSSKLDRFYKYADKKCLL
jgi:hypothetical protein